MITNETSDYQRQFNFLEIIKRDLEDAVKERALEDIVEKQLAEFEAKIRPLIKAEIERLSFQGIDAISDVVQLREEVQLYLKWSDEEKTKKMYKVESLVETEVLDN